MSEINLSEQEVLSLDEASQEKKPDPSVLELPWDEIEPIMRGHARMKQLDRELALMLLETEKKKAELLDEIGYVKELVHQKAVELKDSKGIDSTLSYQLKLPVDMGEPGYFIRNDE